MKTKFLFVCAETFDAVPTTEKVKNDLKCKSVIDLSTSVNELEKNSKKTRYKAGPLQRIYSSMCEHYSYYFFEAWGIDPKKYYTRKLMNVFLISDDAEIGNLVWATLKDEFKYKAFTLDDKGIDPLDSWIQTYKYLNEQFERHYDEYKKRRDEALAILENEISDAEKAFYASLEAKEQDLLLYCKKEAHVYTQKISDAMNSGWN